MFDPTDAPLTVSAEIVFTEDILVFRLGLDKRIVKDVIYPES